MNRKIEFLSRLFELSSDMEEILMYLSDEKLISAEEVSQIKNDPMPYRQIHAVLTKLKATDKLLLTDYEWVILPVERLKLTIISEKSKKEFVYNY